LQARFGRGPGKEPAEVSLEKPFEKAGLFATCLAGTLVALALILVPAKHGTVGAQVGKLFKPPSAAVVDISVIFEDYQKKIDRESEMKEQTKGIEEKLKELEKRYKEIQSEIGNLAEGPKKRERQVQKYMLELEVKDYKEGELKRLEDMQLNHVKEIRDEIEAEIQAYAKSNDIDLILEKTVTAAREGPRWPICHFAKPELDISRDILGRLNSRYRKP
jgi:Skp family chaperone for outer membrane proteins